MTIHFLFESPTITGFFGIMMAEILLKKIKGEFDDISAIKQPLYGAIGGVIGPMFIYLCLILIFGYEQAWMAAPVVAATDVVFSKLTGKINFKATAATITFLTILAIGDDIIIVLLSIFIPNPDHPFNPWGLLLISLLIGLAGIIFKIIYKPEQQFWVMIILGALMWNALLFTGLHPILAFVFIMPFVVKNLIKIKQLEKFEEKILGKYNPQRHEASGRKALLLFEHRFKRIVDIGLFGFGFVSGGVVISDMEIFFAPYTLIIAGSIILGKAIFIPLAASIAGGKAYTVRERIDAGRLGGIGFTVAILMAGITLKNMPELREQAVIGATMSLIIVVLIELIIKIFKRKQTWKQKLKRYVLVF